MAVDYDPGASEVNQLNRIKLMISVAKANLCRQGGRGEEGARPVRGRHRPQAVQEESRRAGNRDGAGDRKVRRTGREARPFQGTAIGLPADSVHEGCLIARLEQALLV